MAAQLILGLSILVTLHELGHYLAARAFGIKVEKFFLFFDAWKIKLFSFKKGETEYGVGWLPLGGYVKIAGMIDESMDKEQMAQPPQPWEFRAKPAWQRLIVMVAGVAMNVLLGISIYSFYLLNYKQYYLPNQEVKQGVHIGTLGREIGLQDGDRILAINGQSFERFDDLLSTRIMFGATLTIQRDGKTTAVKVPDNFYKRFYQSGTGTFLGAGAMVFQVSGVVPGSNAESAGLLPGDTIVAVNGQAIRDEESLKETFTSNKGGQVALRIRRDSAPIRIDVPVSDQGLAGFYYRPTFAVNPDYQRKAYTLGTALRYGTSDAFESLVSNAKGLRRIFTGEEKASESIQGPIGIATIYGGTWEWAKFWYITGLLSMILAFMNILPIPALDGGHVIFLLVETITRRKLSDKFLERSQIVGMVILLALMIFAFGNDIWKHILN
jgi:regulator of sigma E protease